METDVTDPGELNSLVTAALWRAEQLEGQGAPSEPAWDEVSSLEERLAEILPASQPEGRIARRGAVRAALKAGDPERAYALAQRYLTEGKVPEALREALCEMVEAGGGSGRRTLPVPIRGIEP